MRATGVGPDLAAVRAALDVLAIDVSRGKGEIKQGEALVLDLLKASEVDGGFAGITIGVPVFRALLRVVAAGAGRGRASPKDANRVVALMQQHGWECDVATYNLWLDVVARSARCGHAEVSDGLKVLAKIKASGLTPDVNTFRSLMDVVAWSARRGRASMSDAEKVLDEMTHSGRNPTVGTFNGLMAVLAGMASRNQATVEQGYRVLERLQERGLQPTAVTFSALMAVVAGSARQGKAGINDGEMVLENMARKGVAADVVTYNALLAVCVGVAQHGNAALPEALAVLNRMKRAGISPDPITFNTLLEVVAAASHLGLATSRDAERVLDLMIDYAIPFEITSFRALVRVWQGETSCALARTGRLRGWSAAAGGTGDGLGPRLVAPAGPSSERRGAMERYGALLSVVATAAWAGAATPADVFTLFDRMNLEGLQPTCAMYNLGIEAAIGAASNGMAKLEDGMLLIDHMRGCVLDSETPLAPDQHTYMLLLNFIAVIAKDQASAQAAAAAKEVLTVLSQMHNAGMTPALSLVHLGLDVFVSIALADPSLLSTHHIQALLQEVLEPQVSPTAVTISKAAHLATLAGRPQVSEMVWSIFGFGKRSGYEWDRETHLEVLCAVCAAPPAASSQRDERILSLLEVCLAFNDSDDDAAGGREESQAALAAAMSAASGTPATVLFLQRVLTARGFMLSPDMRRIVAKAQAACSRARAVQLLCSPLALLRKGAAAALGLPLRMVRGSWGRTPRARDGGSLQRRAARPPSLSGQPLSPLDVRVAGAAVGLVGVLLAGGFGAGVGFGGFGAGIGGIVGRGPHLLETAGAWAGEAKRRAKGARDR
jgi:hypothetical protein